MKDQDKTKEQLINELVELRQRVTELEAADTERKPAQEELSVAYDTLASSVNGVIIADLEGKIIYANPAFLRMFGYEDRDQVIGKRAAELFPSERVQKFSDVQAIIDKVKGETEEFLARRRDSTIFHVEVSSSIVTDREGNDVGRMASFVDITKRKRAEERIEHLSAVLRAIRSVNQLIIRERDRDRLLQGACDRLIETCGYDNAWIALMDETGALVTATGAGSDKEFLPILERLKRGELPDCAQQALSQSEVVVTDGLSLPRADRPLAVNYGGGGVMIVRLGYGEKVYGLLSISVSADFATIEEEHALFREVAGDIAFALYSIELEEKRKRAEEALRESEERLRSLMETVPVGISMSTPEEGVVEINPAVLEIFGYASKEEFLKIPASAHYCDPKERERFLELHEKGMVGDFEARFKRKDGSVIWLSLTSTSQTNEDGQTLLINAFKDITERKRAEREAKSVRQQIEFILGATKTGLDIIDSEFNIRYIDPEWQKVYGDPTGRKCFEYFMGRGEVCPDCGIPKALETKTATVTEEVLVKEGNRPVQVTTIPFQDDEGEWLVAEVKVDITERKRAERLLRALNEAALAMERALTPDEIFTAVAQELKKLGFSCTISLVDESQKRLSFKYFSYEAKAVKVAEKLLGLKAESFSLPIETVDVLRKTVEERKTVFIENIEEFVRQMLPKPTKRFAGQVVKMLKVSKSIQSPLVVQDKVIGVFSVEADDLTEEDVPAITAFAHQLAAAWRKAQLMQDLEKSLTKMERAQEELRQSYVKLRGTLEGTVNALASAIEMRDPYTAGHQRRVADLARAIANEMGLPQEQIDGIRMAGLIHDLGKINVPAEILSKPTQLTEFEWGMIEGHPQVGYDILKTVEFPWPVAQIVLQHHERINRSGYPDGLSGEEILLEARILAVADVVEAMASHRPYRPALGIDKALEEISQNKGVLYDPEVVDVCLKLFTEKGFGFG